MCIHGMRGVTHDPSDLCGEVMGMCHEQQEIGMILWGMKGGNIFDGTQRISCMGVVWIEAYATHVQSEQVGSQWHGLEWVMIFNGHLWVLHVG